MKTSIGKWKGLERAELGSARQAVDGGSETNLLLSGDVLVFDRGQKCWNGPARSLRVALACGPEDVLSAVAEPDTCAYTAILETPAACSPGLKDALLRSCRAGRGGDTDGDGFDNARDGVMNEL